QLIQPPPIAMDIRLDVPVPDEQIVHELQGKTLFDCSWLHSLKSWSLLKTRGDSGGILGSSLK
ncbi:hypothetical protein SAMN05216309_1161, partial [Nitrosomonas europaea]